MNKFILLFLTIFILLFLTLFIMSIVYFLKFLINVLRKKPAKRKLLLSGYFFGSSIICIIVFSLFTLETYQKEANHLDNKETEKTSSEILTLPQKTNDKEKLASEKKINDEKKKREKEERLAKKKQKKENER